MAGPEEPGSPAVAAALLFFRDEAASATASRALYEALRTAKLLVPIIGAVGESEDELDVRMVAAHGERGGARLLAFTSERTFQLGGQVPPFALARATDLCSFALRHEAHELSIDSGGPVSAALEHWELGALAGGRSPRANRPPRPPLTMSAISRELPAAVESVLRAAFAGAPVLLLEERVDGRRHLVLGSVSEPAVPREELRRRLTPLVGDDRVSVLRLSPDEATDLERAGVRCLC